jgi:hypothetical protein
MDTAISGIITDVINYGVLNLLALMGEMLLVVGVVYVCIIGMGIALRKLQEVTDVREYCSYHDMPEPENQEEYDDIVGKMNRESDINA